MMITMIMAGIGGIIADDGGLAAKCMGLRPFLGVLRAGFFVL